jgi:hypothetical protein
MACSFGVDERHIEQCRGVAGPSGIPHRIAAYFEDANRDYEATGWGRDAKHGAGTRENDVRWRGNWRRLEVQPGRPYGVRDQDGKSIEEVPAPDLPEGTAGGVDFGVEPPG